MLCAQLPLGADGLSVSEYREIQSDVLAEMRGFRMKYLLGVHTTMQPAALIVVF